MNTQFTLKNFRVFDANEGGKFNLSPITILTGCNSSGKSSLVKAILLLKNFCCNLLSNDIDESRLDFNSKITRLGGFNLVRNKGSKKGERIYFSYTTTPRIFKEAVLVEMWFASDNKDKLDNGWLEQFVIRRVADEKIIIKAEYKRPKNNSEGTILHLHKIDFNVILNQFYKSVFRDLLFKETSGDALYRYTGAPGYDDETVDAFKNEFEELKKCLSRYASQQEVKDACIFTEEPYKSKYYKNKYIYTEASNLGVLLPLPILSKLKGVKKEELRDNINGLIEEYLTHVDDKLKKIRILGFKEEVLSPIIAEFENSKFNDFISYYKAKEQEGLIFKDLKKEIKFEGLGAEDTKGKESRFQNRIDRFSSLLYIITGIAESLCVKPDWEEEFGFYPQSFNYLHDSMIILSKYIDNKKLYDKYISHIHDEDNFILYDEHKIFTDLCNYFDELVAQSLSPKFIRDFEYIQDSAIEVNRVYTIDNGNRFAQLLSEYLEASRKDVWEDIKPGDFVNKWIRIFGIGDRISIEKTGEGYGILIRLYKSKEDKKGIVLADEGFGVTKFIATLLNVELAILREPKTFEAQKSKSNNSNRFIQTLAIEEPENHLHPKFQSMLAEMFMEAYKKYRVQFIIETHSEYLIRKLQTLVAKKELTPDEVSLQYVYDALPENRPVGEPHVKDIPIREDGTLKCPFGPGFFDEADNQAMDLLTIKAMS